MYVCICNAVTDTRIREAARSGVASLWELQKDLGVASNCGKCREVAMRVLRDELAAARAESASDPTASSV